MPVRALQTKESSRGLATGDLDNDGDLDFVVINNDRQAEIAINNTKDLGNFVSLWLEGTKSNRSAIGTVVTATIGNLQIKRELVGASSYLSGCDDRLHFGLGHNTQIDKLVIRWPSGMEQVISDLAGARFYHVVEGLEPVVVTPGASAVAP